MNYPLPTAPTTVPRDLGHTLVQAHQQLAHTGSDIVAYIAFGALLLVFGLVLLALVAFAATR